VSWGGGVIPPTPAIDTAGAEAAYLWRKRTAAVKRQKLQRASQREAEELVMMGLL
jgi:hypothetical protein